MTPPPNIEDRTPEEFSAQVREILARVVPGGWTQGSAPRDSGEALISIFGHLCGIVAERLNQAPYKNLLAFLDLQGVSVRPARAALVPLTFQLATQYTGHVKVPANTQVAATLKEGEHDAVIFETERDLVVTSANLSFVGTKDGSHDRFSNYSFLSQAAATVAVPILHATTPIDHILYIDLRPPLALEALKELRLNVQISAPENTVAKPWFEWGVLLEHGISLIAPTGDATDYLTKSGPIIFRNLPDVPVMQVAGVRGRWLVCRMTVPFGSTTVSSAVVPSLERLQATEVFARQALAPDGAFVNQSGLDLTKEFFPFGERPKFGDTFYLSSSEAFACSGTAIKLQFVLANPDAEASGVSMPPVHATAVKLRWEIGDGLGWIELGTSESGREMQNEATGFSDSTKAFTRSGSITFRVPRNIAPSAINRMHSVWVRVRIVGGDYGLDIRYEKAPAGGVALASPTLSPPCLHSMSIDYTLEAISTPAAVIAYNDFTYSHIDLNAGPAPVFQPSADPYKCAYFGFVDQSGFSERFMSIYVAVDNPDTKLTPSGAFDSPSTIIWEYWNGATWAKLTVWDETAGFMHSGIIRFVAPRDFTARPQFGESVYWLRFRMRDETRYEPWVHRVVLNTTFAKQAVSVPAEVLGSSNGAAGQRFLTTRSPVLEGQKVEIREPVMPSGDEKADIVSDEGIDAIRKAADAEGRPGEVWVRWHEVPNFEASLENERHYIIDRTSGEIAFGDGVNGRIPPAGSKNIRIAQYMTGGGAAGNRKENTVTQLKSAVPYIEKVTNLEPAGGGADVETYDAMLQRAPRQIRHGWRAVTSQDFEDLALMASPEVARARCTPMGDFSKGGQTKAPRSGAASLIIAPVSDNAGAPASTSQSPKPSRELIDRVRSYLDAHRALEADLVITGPQYVAIEVETEISITTRSTPSDVESAVSEAIVQFLHPITGNLDGSGWQFGQEPTRASLFALVEEVPGVDHVRELRIRRIESQGDEFEAGQFLIFGVEPHVVATLET